MVLGRRRPTSSLALLTTFESRSGSDGSEVVGDPTADEPDLKHMVETRISDFRGIAGECGTDTGRCRVLMLVRDTDDLMDIIDGRTRGAK